MARDTSGLVQMGVGVEGVATTCSRYPPPSMIENRRLPTL